MADTIPDIIVPYDEYVKVSDITSLLDGEAFELEVKSTSGVYIQEVTTKPDNSSTDGRSLDGRGGRRGVSVAYIEAGSNSIWIKASSISDKARVNIQGV